MENMSVFDVAVLRSVNPAEVELDPDTLAVEARKSDQVPSGRSPRGVVSCELRPKRYALISRKARLACCAYR